MHALASPRLEGYRALFDPRWIPRDLVGRDKELAFLHGFLSDNLAIKQLHDSCEGLGSTILINGMTGIGKATLARKVMQVVASGEASSAYLPPVAIDCKEKEPAQVLAELSGRFKLQPDAHATTRTTRDTWGTLSAWLRTRVDCSRLNLCLSNFESIALPFVGKLCTNLKHLGINLLLTTRMRLNTPLLDQVDVDITLDEYKPADLHAIVDARARSAFNERLAPDVTRFITDAVIEYDSPRPQPCINILRNLYPRVTNTSGTTPASLDMVQDCIRHALPGVGYGEFDMADFFSNAPIHAIVFVDNIVSWFGTSSECYLPRPVLENMYDMACEHLDIASSSTEFEVTMADLLSHNILIKSNHGVGTYFMMVPPSIMRTFIDEVLC